ncbi:MFS transporter [Bradyrhizobium sp. UFLA05-112]
MPSKQSLRALDWFIFFLADVQTGFGPFIAVYLTTQKWTQVEIGLVLSIGGIVALIGQMPGGAIIDAAKSERLVAGLAIATIGCCALAYAAMPIFPVVVTAATLHAAASCVLGPAIAAISLGLVGPFAIGERLGRNARFASLGNGVAAAVMGTAGYLLSSRSVFLVTFLLAIPTLIALSRIREEEVDVARAHGEMPREAAEGADTNVWHLLRQRPLLIFACSVMLLQLANAAMLPLMASVVTTRSSQWATVLIAGCIIVPQAIVALMSPSVGRKAQAWGRRPLLLLGFGALAIRGLLFATVRDPYLLVLVQVFDGITAAVFAVMIPLIVADVAFGSGHFNLAQGVVGTATGIGASLSTVLGGFISDRFGSSTAFVGLACVAAAGLVLILLVMPETRRSAG